MYFKSFSPPILSSKRQSLGLSFPATSRPMTQEQGLKNYVQKIKWKCFKQSALCSLQGIHMLGDAKLTSSLFWFTQRTFTATQHFSTVNTDVQVVLATVDSESPKSLLWNTYEQHQGESRAVNTALIQQKPTPRACYSLTLRSLPFAHLDSTRTTDAGRI